MDAVDLLMQEAGFREALGSFPHELVATASPEGDPEVAFVHEDFEIFDVTVSTCGRFLTSPATYGLTPEQVSFFTLLQAKVAKLVSEALDQGKSGESAGDGVEARQELLNQVVAALVSHTKPETGKHLVETLDCFPAPAAG